MNNITISIIIPAYNAEKYIARCLDSISCQTYKYWECIVINDGSKDKTGDICKYYADKDSRFVIIQKENGGVSSARNLGLQFAHNEWITFIDADDWIKPNYLETFLYKELTHKTIVYQGVMNEYIDHAEPWYAFQNNIYEGSLLKKGIEEHKLLHKGCSFPKLYNINIIRQNSITFSTNLPLHEDHVFTLEYLQFVDRIIVCDNIGYHYDHRGEGTSASSREYDARVYAEAARELIPLMVKCKNKFKLNDNSTYFKEAISFYGFRQLHHALAIATSNHINLILSVIKENKDVLQRYYIPNLNLKWRLFMSSLLYTPSFFAKILFSLKRKHKTCQENV